jgi:hypothetical protein
MQVIGHQGVRMKSNAESLWKKTQELNKPLKVRRVAKNHPPLIPTRRDVVPTPNQIDSKRPAHAHRKSLTGPNVK